MKFQDEYGFEIVDAATAAKMLGYAGRQGVSMARRDGRLHSVGMMNGGHVYLARAVEDLARARNEAGR